MFKLLKLLIPFWSPLYTLIHTINIHNINIIKSKNNDWLKLRSFEIDADIKGNERAKPTPAPVRIAPMKNISRIILIGPDCFSNRIPEKVKGVFEFLISDNTKATVGRIYSDQPVNIQWNIG